DLMGFARDGRDRKKGSSRSARRDDKVVRLRRDRVLPVRLTVPRITRTADGRVPSAAWLTWPARRNGDVAAIVRSFLAREPEPSARLGAHREKHDAAYVAVEARRGMHASGGYAQGAGDQLDECVLRTAVIRDRRNARRLVDRDDSAFPRKDGY